MAQITLTGNLVVWNGFAQPYRLTRDYTKFGPFLFAREQYEARTSPSTTPGAAYEAS
jgi:hypothetical protein